MIKRNWYHKDNGNTILWGEPDDVARNYPTAIKISSERPSPMHFWNTKTRSWHIPKHLELSKSDKQLIPPAIRPINPILHFIKIQFLKIRKGGKMFFSKKKDKDKDRK